MNFLYAARFFQPLSCTAVLLLTTFSCVAADTQSAPCLAPTCNHPEVSEAPAFDLRFSGRLQLDRGYFYNDKNTDFEHGDKVRRARFGFTLNYGKHWQLSHTYDFAKDGLEGIRDTTLQYRNGQGMRYTIGHFKEPFAMERLTSVRDLAFMERSLASTLAPSRARGVEIHHHHTHATTAIGFFGNGFEDSSHNTRHGIAARHTFAPRSADGDVLHFGASIAYRNTDSSREVRFRQRFETRNSDVRLVDTGRFLAKDFTYFGLESAYAKGSFAIQSEYIHAVVRDARETRQDAGRTIHFQGWHVDLSWILTGESQPYNQEKGTFGRIKPHQKFGFGSIGAVRTAIRWSALDLTDDFVQGGHQQNLGASLSWYLNDHVTIIGEYLRVIRLKGAIDNASPYVYQARLQLAF